MSERSIATNIAALLAGIDELGNGAQYRHRRVRRSALNEIGIANGSLTIDDRRGAYEWKLTQISLSLNRPKGGGVALTVLSENQDRPWALSAALSPAPQGHRRLQLEARKVVLDDLLALRMAESRIRSDTLRRPRSIPTLRRTARRNADEEHDQQEERIIEADPREGGRCPPGSPTRQSNTE